MDRIEAQNRIDQVTELLNDASRRYYVDNSPVMTDYEFDMFLKELEQLEKEYPNELNVYYEDENFICYCLEQNPNRLFNLGTGQ